MDYKAEGAKLLFEACSVKVWLLFGRNCESALCMERLNSSLPSFAEGWPPIYRLRTVVCVYTKVAVRDYTGLSSIATSYDVWSVGQ